MPVPDKLYEIESRWAERFKGSKEKWQISMQMVDFNEWKKALSKATGVPVAKLNGPLVTGFSNFIANPDGDFDKGANKVTRQHKWAKQFYYALTGEKPEE